MTNGQISVLYSAATSINGAKLLANKGPARKVTIEDMSDALAAPTILTPHALPMFRDGEDGIARGTKRRREKERADPRKSRRPELPVTGPGRGGRVGASATQHVVQNLVRDTTRDEDVSDPLFVFSALAPADGWDGCGRPDWDGLCGGPCLAIAASDATILGCPRPRALRAGGLEALCTATAVLCLYRLLD